MAETKTIAEIKENGNNETVEETIIRFRNYRTPQKANENSTNLAAVCCPAFSLA